MPMPDSNSSCTSLHHNKAHGTDLCWTQTGFVTDQRSWTIGTEQCQTQQLYTSLQENKTRDTDLCHGLKQLFHLPAAGKVHDGCLCQTRTALLTPCSTSKLITVAPLNSSALPCNRSNLKFQTFMWTWTWTAEHKRDHRPMSTSNI